MQVETPARDTAIRARRTRSFAPTATPYLGPGYWNVLLTADDTAVRASMRKSPGERGRGRSRDRAQSTGRSHNPAGRGERNTHTHGTGRANPHACEASAHRGVIGRREAKERASLLRSNFEAAPAKVRKATPAARHGSRVINGALSGARVARSAAGGVAICVRWTGRGRHTVDASARRPTRRPFHFPSMAHLRRRTGTYCSFSNRSRKNTVRTATKTYVIARKVVRGWKRS